jgi:hypothetical protein
MPCNSGLARAPPRSGTVATGRPRVPPKHGSARPRRRREPSPVRREEQVPHVAWWRRTAPARPCGVPKLYVGTTRVGHTVVQVAPTRVASVTPSGENSAGRDGVAPEVSGLDAGVGESSEDFACLQVPQVVHRGDAGAVRGKARVAAGTPRRTNAAGAPGPIPPPVIVTPPARGLRTHCSAGYGHAYFFGRVNSIGSWNAPLVFRCAIKKR